MSDGKKAPPQFTMDTSDNHALPFTRPNAFSQYPGSSNPPPPSYPQQYPPNPQNPQPQYPPAPGVTPYPQQAYYGPPPPGQQQQQSSNVVVIGGQSPDVISQPTAYVNTQTAVILACVVVWFCGWVCGVIAYFIAGELVRDYHPLLGTRQSRGVRNKAHIPVLAK